MKIALTERQSNRHQKQDGTGEPRVARTFLDAHNATSFTPASEYPYCVARPLAWFWVCFSLDFEFRNALPLSLPIRLLSLSLAPIWSRASRDSRAALGCCERSSEAPARWQPVLRPRVSIVGATRLGSEKIEEGLRMALTRVWEHCFTDLFTSIAPQTGWKILLVQIIRGNLNNKSISFKSQTIGQPLQKACGKLQARLLKSKNLNLRKFDFHKFPNFSITYDSLIWYRLRYSFFDIKMC